MAHVDSCFQSTFPTIGGKPFLKLDCVSSSQLDRTNRPTADHGRRCPQECQEPSSTCFPRSAKVGAPYFQSLQTYIMRRHHASQAKRAPNPLCLKVDVVLRLTRYELLLPLQRTHISPIFMCPFHFPCSFPSGSEFFSQLPMRFKKALVWRPA